MSNYQSNGTDFDSLFEALDTTKIANVNFQDSGSDISNDFEPLSEDQQIPNVNFQKAGVDVSTLFKGHISQFASSTKLTATRTTAWNGTLTYSFTVTFSSVSARTNFFTYGGRITVSSTRTGGSSTSKNTNWSTILSNMGLIGLGKNNTYHSSLPADSTGDVNLNGTYATLYGGIGTGVYAENDILVQARETSSTVIQVVVYFRDDDSGDPTVDENVDGTLTLYLGERRHPSQSSPTFTGNSTIP